MIEFLLKDTVHRLQSPATDTTALDYLRQQLALTGTKEGCASGDCGACTIVTAGVSPSRADCLEYRAVNACITFAGSLHRHQVITVEHLSQGGELHPVQAAMRDCHASQCGFCTPGFVMSLYALYRNVQNGLVSADSEHQWIEIIEHTLGGNLCRCTGYRSIVDAALQVLQDIPQHAVDAHESETIEQLHKLEHDNVSQSGCHLRFFTPSDVAKLKQLIADYPASHLLAGGTDLALEVTQNLSELPVLISLQRVAEMTEVQDTGDGWWLGAAVPLTRLIDVVKTQYPDWAGLLYRFGSVPVRNQGTLGGNLVTASPIGDLAPVLLALDAQLIIDGAHGQRRVAIDNFFTGYRTTEMRAGEFLTAVFVPHTAVQNDTHAMALKIYKVSKRFDDDISSLCLAVQLYTNDDGTVSTARIACGGMAATPQRATAAEQALLDQPISLAAFKQAGRASADDFTPIDDMRASAEYRSRVLINLFERLYYELCDSQQAVTVTDYVY